MNLPSYGISDIGLSRENNEDVWAELPEWRFYALADGMGGHKAGEVAAQEAVLELCDTVDDFFSENKKPSQEQIIQCLKEGVTHANSWVCTLAQKHPELTGMGTTLCALLISHNTVFYTHLGDSRIYRFSHKKLERLTQDHAVKQPRPSGIRFKTMITRAIGTSLLIEPEIEMAPAKEGDIYFLCSDGLTNHVSDGEIELLLQQESRIKEAAIELVDLAKTKGGNDNITIVIVRIEK